MQVCVCSFCNYYECMMGTCRSLLHPTPPHSTFIKMFLRCTHAQTHTDTKGPSAPSHIRFNSHGDYFY